MGGAQTGAPNQKMSKQIFTQITNIAIPWKYEKLCRGQGLKMGLKSACYVLINTNIVAFNYDTSNCICNFFRWSLKQCKCLTSQLLQPYLLIVISHLKMGGKPRFEEKVKLWNNLRLSRIWCCKMNVKDNTMVSQLQFKQYNVYTCIMLTSLFVGGTAHPLKWLCWSVSKSVSQSTAFHNLTDGVPV